MINLASVAFSPCPNDTYIFYALQAGLIEGFTLISPHLHDIQKLNEEALKSTYSLTKVSLFTALKCIKNYSILPVGSAMGFGCGPLLIGKADYKKVAIPGEGTVAHLLFELFNTKKSVEKVFVSYDEILPKVETGQVDSGVIIHESRFSFFKRGHQQILDFGQLWEEQTKGPLPLGVLMTKKKCDLNVKRLCEGLQQSIEYSDSYFSKALPYILQHAQELEETMVKKHIDLYVNEETKEMSDQGRKAILQFQKIALEKGFLKNNDKQQEIDCFCHAP